jgi:hypothetical protein
MTAAMEGCGLDRRREDVRQSPLLGIDYVEVSSAQTTLEVFFLGRAPAKLAAGNVAITGGAGVTVTGLRVQRERDLTLDDWMEITLNQPGDASTYVLSLVQTDETGAQTDKPLAGCDPVYASASFSFKASCRTDANCAAPHVCPPQARTAPPIDYLAKDYASFRQLILDRLAQTLPDWTETHIPDIGVMLVDLLAYAGDQLSYYQDAVATEAYLGTARRRISVRRHARLVDYRMHEGCNARAWVVMAAEAAQCALDPTSIFFGTAYPAGPAPGILQPADFAKAPAGGITVFEPLLADPSATIMLRKAHNEIRFYTWGDCACCLPVGATSATLADYDQAAEGGGNTPPVRENNPGGGDAKALAPAPLPRALNLSPGDILLFEEVLGPKTGVASDADPTHRQAVRLTGVTPDVDPLYDAERGGRPVLRIAWCAEDALTFPLCLSAVMPAPDCDCCEGISVARGNVILVDQGQTLPPEPLGTAPTDTSDASCATDCAPATVTLSPGRFRPTLAQTPLSFAEPLPDCVCAAPVIVQDPRQALPEITLTSTVEGPGGELTTLWTPAYDLLESGSDDARFVVEVDDVGVVHLRFGNGDEGREPEAGATFSARYRIGNGPTGNVGPEAICYVIFREINEGTGALAPRNPLAATGGTAPEAVADVRMIAPYGFRDVLERAVTADDYATLARDNARRLAERSKLSRPTPPPPPALPRQDQEEEPPEPMPLPPDLCLIPFAPLQNARGTLCWNGSWYEARVALDPRGSESADPELLAEVDAYLAPYGRIGYDLTVTGAAYAALDLGLSICVKPLYLRAQVQALLRQRLGTDLLPDGSLALFNPDRLTFGEAVYLSPIIATAQTIPGVMEVQVTRLDRLVPGRAPPTASPDSVPAAGMLLLAPNEIARLDQDPNHPENGRLTLLLRGGR